MKAILVDNMRIIAVATLFAIHLYFLVKRAKSRRKEDGDIQTLLGTKKSN